MVTSRNVAIASLLLLGACARGGFEPAASADRSSADRLVGLDRPRSERSPGDIASTELAGGDLAFADAPSRETAPKDLAPGADKPAPPLGSFGVPTKLVALSSAQADDDPSLTEDQLEIYFASHRSGGPGIENIWRSTRGSITAAWAAPQPVAALNSTSQDCTPRVSLDGLTLHFASLRSGNFEVYVSTRASRTAAWNAPALVPALASSADDYGGSLSQNGLALAFYSARGGDHDLYLAKRTSPTTPWGAPVEVSELSTPSEEGGPQLDPSERVLFFFSTRPGGKGDRDLWMASRPGPTGPFGAPTPIVELNTPEEESDLWISPDLRTIYFGSRRGGNLDLDLYMATR